MAIPVVVTGLAIGLAVAFYQENQRKGKPVPTEGAEGAAGGQHKSAATGDTMATDETGSVVAVKETDAGPMVIDAEDDIEGQSPAGWTGVGQTVQETAQGMFKPETPVSDMSRASPIIRNAAERIGMAWAKKPAGTTVQKPMPAHGGKGTGIRPIPIASMSTKGMSKMQASKNLGIWAGQNRLVR